MLKWIKAKYFQSIGSRTWVFREKDDPVSLIKLSDIPILRHIKIKANANPYDRIWRNYFINRSTITVGCVAVPYQCLSPVR